MQINIENINSLTSTIINMQKICDTVESPTAPQMKTQGITM